MHAAYVIQFQTPKKIILNGLLYGPKKPKRVIIWLHGFTGSVFSGRRIISKLVDKNTAVLAFNNRGHDSVARLSQIRDKTQKSIIAGASHEKFEDCVDDIQGAINFVRKMKVRDVYLAGHSTGCQKAVYWAYKSKKGVKGIILLGPVSDYASALKSHGARKLQRLARVASRMVRAGKANAFMPESVWGGVPDDAQRFISLYTPNSIEQSIFSYFDPKRPAKILKAVTIPILALWAEKDEYSDRPAKTIIEWFRSAGANRLRAAMVSNVAHSFKGGEVVVAKTINKWFSLRG